MDIPLTGQGQHIIQRILLNRRDICVFDIKKEFIHKYRDIPWYIILFALIFGEIIPRQKIQYSRHNRILIRLGEGDSFIFTNITCQTNHIVRSSEAIKIINLLIKDGNSFKFEE